MFFIEHRKGRTSMRRETSGAPTFEAVLAYARARAADLGADNIVIRGRAGRVAGVFSTYSNDID